MTLFIHTSTHVTEAPEVGDKLAGAALIWTVEQVGHEHVVLTHPLSAEPWALDHDDFAELLDRGLLTREQKRCPSGCSEHFGHVWTCSESLTSM